MPGPLLPQMPVVKTTMTIVADSLGNVFVTGPLDNKMLCYGILERAKDHIRDYQPPMVQPVPAGSIPMKPTGS